MNTIEGWDLDTLEVRPLVPGRAPDVQAWSAVHRRVLPFARGLREPVSSRREGGVVFRSPEGWRACYWTWNGPDPECAKKPHSKKARALASHRADLAVEYFLRAIEREERP